ncbi:MAG: AMP-binding protein [Oscillospiraceae bacterium]|jgi:fatty-acyl-CoA synthase|nr:AMP-binding protein [Oscillospiraceae bacterium]
MNPNEGLLWEITIGEQMNRLAREYPDREAVAYTDRDYRRTWKSFNEEIDRVARAFMALGIKKGEHVAVWATNVPEWILTFFAAIKIGAVLVTVNTAYKIYELEYLLRQSDSKALVMIDGFKDTDYVQIVNELCPEIAEGDPGNQHIKRLPRLKMVIHAGKHTPAGMIPFAALDTLSHNVPESEYRALSGSLTCDEIINMQYTSGTTGFPKGVMLTHRNILNNGRFIGDNLAFTTEDKLCITVPFFHCFGMVLAIMACIAHGTAMVPVDIFSPLKVMEAVENERCTALHGVPTMFIAILSHPEFSRFTFPVLRTGIMAGSPCPIKTMEQVVSDMHLRHITSVFGQTESSPGCTQTSVDDPLEYRTSTVGRSLPGCENRIVDPETNQPLPVGVQGEFCTRGYHVMKGYYNMPEATAQAIDSQGWLHTGDLAVVDENGYYKITGRIKDMIIRGGENIYPKEIEDFIYRHPAVSDVQVIGVPSVRYGEEICACIILKKGQSATEDELKTYVRGSMARHKTPSYVWFVDSFPMTASGKIQKFKLREIATERFGLQEAGQIETA